MVDQTASQPQGHEHRPARDWVRILAKYREPDVTRSAFELVVTLLPFLALWALAWWALEISVWLSIALSLVNGGFVVRLFAIQHDCGHGAFFNNRTLSDWVGRVLGVLTLTPYDVWRHSHSIHHSAAGNLERRGIGDVHTLTVAEYRAMSPLGRLHYRLYRHPLVLFGLGPFYLFFLQNRLPVGFMDQPRFWISAMATNAAILALWVGIYALGGWAPLLFIYLPSTLMAASAGVWLFYVQHQFETTLWDCEEDWQLHEAALHGSSHYVMPGVLQWISANIGIHHVHHLYSRIPFYRLPDVLRDHAELDEGNRMTIRESLANARLHLWDEGSRRLLSFAEARRVPS
ncbi:fatty acid desaturase [Primorskyibacter aestuariivivens]|uniref:fatty acid desaturase n=1 Tax=Primorskyibacter aestuariivivens TaxID=1888912 RepID=UPI00230187A3|nr:fatty acid desaturase [Primorskyibacter aestuariivivens]MDA7427870.1 fatty acid desaturase [Primorskyibacter aestuariivivens]